jgi:hypothetical protein
VWRLTTQHGSDSEHKGKGADIEQQGDLDHEGYYGPRGRLGVKQGAKRTCFKSCADNGSYPSGDVTSGQSEDCPLYCSSLYTTRDGLCVV